MTTYKLISEDIYHEFLSANNALVLNGHSQQMEQFKTEHPNEYKLITQQWRKRAIISDCIGALFETKERVFWGSLTFDEEHDKSSEKNKRQQAIRHLNYCFASWVMVEEHGEEEGRYHVHFIGIFHPDKTIVNDFTKWHSRQDINEIYKRGCKKVARYLTNYLEKQAPRIRKNKTMIEMLQHYKKARKWANLGFNSLAEDENTELLMTAFPLPF